LTDGAPSLRDLAEEAYAYLPTQSWVHLHECDGFVLRLANARIIPETSLVLRPRLDGARLPAVVDEIRARMEEDDRKSWLWWVGPRATPEGLGAKLEALGLEPYERDPVYAGMTLEAEPPAVDGVEVRGVETLEELDVFADVSRAGWSIPDDVFDQIRESARENWVIRDPALDSAWVAFVDGEPVGNAVSQYVGKAVYLGGSCVIPEARGRGVYRALLRKRWEDGRTRDGTALVIQAGAMSRPIVEQLGFTTVCEVRVYVDSIQTR
jgi:GNAT superfamily N-acetyltransferase